MAVFPLYHRWAKKRKTPINLVPRYVFKHGAAAETRGAHGALVNGVGMKMDRICGRGGKTAPSYRAQQTGVPRVCPEYQPVLCPRSVCPVPSLQSRRGEAQRSEQAQLPSRQGGGGGAGGRQWHEEEISQTRSCRCRQG